MLMQSPEPIAYDRYKPNAMQGVIMAITRAMPNMWLTKRVAFLLRKLVLMRLKTPIDTEVFGLKWRLYPKQNLCEKRILFTPQWFDVVEREILRRYIKPDAIFLDIGANIGAYTLYVSSLVGPEARVYAFEPQPEIYERLLYNLSLNPTHMVKALACAVADKDGEMTLFLNRHNKGEASVVLLGQQDMADIETFTVPCKTLLTVIEEEALPRIDAIKLDVEGAEDLILAPFFRDAAEAFYPKLIILENARTRWATDLVGLLQDKGYRLIAETRMNLVFTLAQN